MATLTIAESPDHLAVYLLVCEQKKPGETREQIGFNPGIQPRKKLLFNLTSFV